MARSNIVMYAIVGVYTQTKMRNKLCNIDGRHMYAINERQMQDAHGIRPERKQSTRLTQ